jgi:hypothetical protein
VDLASVETKPSIQESIGIFQLIDQLETAVDKLLERQVYVAFTVQFGVIKTDVAIQYCSKCLILLTNLNIQNDNNVYIMIFLLFMASGVLFKFFSLRFLLYVVRAAGFDPETVKLAALSRYQ